MGPEEEKGFIDGYFDGDGAALMPSFISTDKEMLEYIKKLLKKRGIRTSPPVIQVKAGTTYNGIKTNHNVYAIYIHPFDYDKFEETVKTCIPRKQHLIKISKKIIENYRPDYISEDGWWEVCTILQKAVGKNMRIRRKRRR